LSKADFLSRISDFRINTKPANDPIAGSWEETIGLIDGEVKFIQIVSVSTMLTLMPVDDKKDVRKVVDSVLDEVNDGAASTTGKLLTQAGIEWTWMNTEQGLVDGLFNGFAICFPVAFLVLVFATYNAIVSTFAILSIVLIVASVLGIVQLMGYDLGVAESIAGIIVIGFSVDYVVHLAHMYMEAFEKGKKSRIERVVYACENMGGTVVAGAVTTGGSGSFMFACQLVFFFKMALLICLTIAFSFIYAFLFFIPALALLGPNGAEGSIRFGRPKEAVWAERDEKMGVQLPGAKVTDENL
jgi:predicted RND superfamily exporter protein